MLLAFYLCLIYFVSIIFLFMLYYMLINVKLNIINIWFVEVAIFNHFIEGMSGHIYFVTIYRMSL